jgi:hypothetical protein
MDVHCFCDKPLIFCVHVQYLTHDADSTACEYSALLQYSRMRPIHIQLYIFFNIYIQEFTKLFLGFYIYDT